MAGTSILITPKEGILLINAKTAADTTGIGVVPEEYCGRYVECSFYVDFSHASAAGTVLIESAPYRDYQGTWVLEATVTWSAIDKAHRASLNLLTGAMRARISSAVTSGTCDVRFFASTNS
jgi:hypothetical protein